MTQSIGQHIERASFQLSAKGAEAATLEAEVLLADVLKTTRTRLLARSNEQLTDDAAQRFASMLERRLAGEPLAYIIGRREFYGVEVRCHAEALIPRPETEMLVELALAEAIKRRSRPRIADVGTGTGAIAVAVAVHAPHALVTATDVSAKALGLARENAVQQGVTNINFVGTNLLAGLGEFDVIVANLPYVSEVEWRSLPVEIRQFEPRAALVGGVRGTEAIEGMLALAPGHLAPGGVLGLEIGAQQGASLSAAAKRFFPRARILARKDLAGLDRVLEVRT